MRWTRMLLVMLGALFAVVPAASANTYTVTGTGDQANAICFADVCPTLRAAVTAAASPGGPHTISLPAGSYQLTQGQLLLNADVTITGAGARTTSVRGNPNAFRVLEVATGKTVSISGVTLRDGRATDENSPTFYTGGVVLNHGNLTLDRVRVTGGHASSGGGIANLSGTLVVEHSLIDHNAADIGGSDSGGILNFNAGNVTVRNSTIAFNQAAPGKAGGYLSWGAAGNTALFEFVTVAHNTGGGLNYSAGNGDTLQLRGSIVANNNGGNCFTVPTKLGGNVETSDDCQLEERGAGNAVGAELQNLGGDTDVLVPVPGSAAFDLITGTAPCPQTDQRGFTRPVGAGCDAGAFEFDPNAGPTPVLTFPTPDLHTSATELTFTGTAQPNEIVNVYRGTSVERETQADPQGAWTARIDLPAAEGVYRYEVGTPTSPGRAAVDVTVDRTAPETTIDTKPSNPTNSSTATFTYSSNEPGAQFSCRFFGPGNPNFTFEECPTDGKSYASLTDGEYKFDVRATDQAGNTDGSFATYTFVIDTDEPATTITSGPPATTNLHDVSFTYRSDEPVTFRCRLIGPDHEDDNEEACPNAGRSYTGLRDGPYEFRVRAVDLAGNETEVAGVRTFTIDSALIAAPNVSAPAIEPTAATFTFSTTQAGRTFRCRLEGPGQDGAFTDCASPRRYSNLQAGAYRFTVRSSDQFGNFADSARAFSVTGPVVTPQQTPTPTPTPRPTETPTPQPERGETVVVRPTGGKVLIQIPPSKTFVELKSIDDIPLGATIDAKNGRVQLRFESEPGKVQTAVFYGGIFLVRQVGKVLDVKLTEALAACPKGKKASAAQSKKKPKKRKLWGDGKGSFRTTGKYSAATVRGTRWLVEDSCAGTLTRVTSGVVAVKDRKKTILVRAGKRYLAKAR